MLSLLYYIIILYHIILFYSIIILFYYYMMLYYIILIILYPITVVTYLGAVLGNVGILLGWLYDHLGLMLEPSWHHVWVMSFEGFFLWTHAILTPGVSGKEVPKGGWGSRSVGSRGIQGIRGSIPARTKLMAGMAHKNHRPLQKQTWDAPSVTPAIKSMSWLSSAWLVELVVWVDLMTRKTCS